MQISKLFEQKKPVISFEIFPPKKDSDTDKLLFTIDELKNLHPDFISVTYGAAGSDSTAKTLEIASIVKNKYKIEALMHLTCIAASKSGIQNILSKMKEANIENVLALRGDIPQSVENINISTDYQFAKDLIYDIRDKGFCIGAASYPEGHISCEDFDLSIMHLKQKVKAGTEFLISQLFFDNELFYKFQNAAASAGINVPLVAGVMPILGVNQIKRMIFMCGASLPAKIIKILNKYENDPASLKQAGIEYCYHQISNLIKNGVDGVHIYTMNMPEIAIQNVNRLLNEQLL